MAAGPLKLTGSAQRAMEVPHDAHDSSERSHCTAISAHFTRYMSNVGLRNATTATGAVALNSQSQTFITHTTKGH